MKSTSKITFYVNKGKEKNGFFPFLGRITINGSIAQFGCKASIYPKLRNTKDRAIGRSEQALKVNRTLNNINNEPLCVVLSLS